ncbi:MAG: TPM domain-containing protein [Ferruginibacter sp.]
MFSFFKKKDLFTVEENERIVAAIRNSEKRTSGEIRIYIEPKNPLVDPLERAALIFAKLKMDETEHRNAVLLYMATDHKELALYGDKGIHEKVGEAYWQNEVQQMLQNFRNNNLVDGIVNCITHIGETLCEKFPYIATEDKNELPDEIIFGK